KNDEAVSILNKGLEINSEYFPLLAALVNIYFSQNKFDEAISLAKKTLEKKPDYADMYFVLGNIYLKQERHQETINAFKKAVELNPELDNFYTSYALGTSYQSLGMEAEAFFELKKAVDRKPEFAFSQKALAEWYFKRKQ